MKITNLRIKTRETIAVMDITNDVNLRWVRSVSKTSPSPKAAGPLSKPLKRANFPGHTHCRMDHGLNFQSGSRTQINKREHFQHEERK